jgi:hypothetical protein
MSVAEAGRAARRRAGAIRTWAPLVLFLLGLPLVPAACAPARAGGDPTPSIEEFSATAVDSAEESGRSADATSEEVLRAADEIERQVVLIRGLSFKSPIPRVVRTGAEIRRDFLEARFDDLFPPKKRIGDEKAFALFGLLPPKTDLKVLMLDLLAEQVGGYFDPWQKELTVRSDYPLGVLKVIMAHEITHALEDQYFDLGKMILESQDDDDLAFAHGSISEGSAMDVMLRYGASDPSLLLGAMGDSSIAQTDVLLKAPPYIAYSLVLPYVKGLAFIQYWKSKGMSTDDIYANLPRSSEQILHPEKYGKDEPVAVVVPDLAERLGSFWSEVARGRLGEVGVSAVFLPLLSPGPIDVAAIAGATGTDYVASGWGGDAYVAYENSANGRVLVYWRTVWDTELDATEFEHAFHDLVYRRDPGARLISTDPAWTFRTSMGEFVLRRDGLSMDVLLGAFPDQAGLVLP